MGYVNNVWEGATTVFLKQVVKPVQVKLIFIVYLKNHILGN